MALDLYELYNGRYLAAEEGLGALLTKPASAVKWKGPYLKREPIDPWGRKYQYRLSGGEAGDYELYSYGPDGVEGGGDDITNLEEEK